MLALWLLLAPALAEDPPRWSGSATFTTSFVSGPRNAGATGSTLTDTYTVGPTYNPSFDFALTLGARVRLAPGSFLAASWSVRRDLQLRDTDPELFDPRNGGTRSTTVLDTSDLVLRWSDGGLVSWTKGDLHFTGGASLVLPASRDSLVCNPLYAALGLQLGVRKGFGPTTGLSLSAGADRAFHKHAAAPRGACSVALRGASAQEPEPWAGEFASEQPNTAWTAHGTLALSGWHGLFGLVPGVAAREGYQRLRSSASLGVLGQVQRRQPAATVQTLTGPVEVEAAEVPMVWRFPMSLSVGASLHEHVGLDVSVSNQIPQLAYDLSTRLRTLPAMTSVSLALSGTW
jgi:hypothetical protein